MRSTVDVAIVGAGPYGLSAAAHAVAAGLDVRVYGRPMLSWDRHMPRGMLLKSEPTASDLADPAGRYGLGAYCRALGRPCADGDPVPVETFADYGRWFGAQAVRDALDESEVTRVRADGGRYVVETASGEPVTARAAVVAAGFLPFAHRPAVLEKLPPEVCTHSCDHADLTRFAGRDVTVVGAGQAALETATLLLEAGARPRVVARAATLRWNAPPAARRTLADRVRAPRSRLGTGWSSWVWSEQPGAVGRLPYTARRHIVTTALGPAGSWWLRERFDGQVPLLTGRHVADAGYEGGRVRLTLLSRQGEIDTVHTDHVVAATGYAVDVGRLAVLDPALRRSIRADAGAPRLTRHFETSAGGLYMIGLAAAATYGPAMRFVCGAGFAARRVTRGLTVSARTRPRRA